MPITLSSADLPTEQFEAYKIVILGSTGVGKTSILNKLINTQSPELNGSAWETVYRKAVTIDGKPCALQFLDTNNNAVEVEKMRHYIHHSDGALVVYNTCSRSSFMHAQSIHADYLKPRSIGHILRNVRGFTNPEHLLAVLLVGNQNDRAGEREVGFVEGLEYAQSIWAAFSECSATTSGGTEPVLEEIVRQIRRVKEAKRELEREERFREEAKRERRERVKKPLKAFIQAVTRK